MFVGIYPVRDVRAPPHSKASRPRERRHARRGNGVADVLWESRNVFQKRFLVRRRYQHKTHPVWK